MSRKKNRLTLFAVVLTMTPSLAVYEIASGQEYLSPAVVVADAQGKTLYIAETTAKQIAVFDIEAAEVETTIAVVAKPTGLTMSNNGKLLYVTCAAPEGSICVIETDTHRVRRQFPAGYGARSPVLSPDGKTLYVCNRFDNDISVISTDQGKQIAAIPALREPVAAALTPDGRRLFVGNHLPHEPSNGDSVACNVSVIDTGRAAFEIDIPLPNGSTGLQDITVSPDGKLVFVSHILARYTVPTTQLERGWINTNAISIIDARFRTLLETVLLDDVDHGAANPWAVACTSDGKLLCVTHAGTHELSVIEIRPLIEKISAHRRRNKVRDERFTALTYTADYYGSGSGSNIPNELSFLYGIRERIKLPGNGPRSLAIVGRKAYVAEYFTDSLAVVDISEDSRHRTSSVALGPKLPMTAERRGEMIFNDALICFQSWQSCASCHPSDARADALNWDLLNDGLGNPKNTKSLLFSHQTPPSMMTGVRATAELAVRAGIRHILFAVRPEEESAAMDEYLKALKPIPSPYLVDGKLSEAARRGRKVFHKAGCSSCHSGPLFTNLQEYDVGTGDGRDKGLKFDTPSLVEIWRTAPYLYDGRAATINDVVTTFNRHDKHGHTSDLCEEEIKDLVEFVLSQ
ncbi:MAG: beta-propeller fold lactonase family protein [Phycisphaerales bacterium]|nr:MAG: beta-propeller fold lactonase family protein [Phycisphaerales bacterium]